MNQNIIFWPMILQALVSLWLYIPMSRARFNSVKTGVAAAHDFKLPKQNEPGKIAHLGNAVSNQFELPVLFFAVCLAAHTAQLVDLPLVITAWAFVLIKSTHSLVHASTNKLRYRFRLFAASFLVMLFMWIWFAIKLALA